MRGAMAAVCAAALVGCGSVSNNPDAGTADASIDASTQPRCDPTAPFGSATGLTGGINTTNAIEDSGRLLPGERDLLFARVSLSPTSNYDIYLASRPGSTGDFGAAAPLAGVNTQFHDSSPTATADFLTLYLSSATQDPNGNLLYQVYVTTRTATTQPFGPISVVPIDGSAQAVYPYVTLDGGAIYFSRADSAVGRSDIRWSQRGTGGFGASQAITEVNSAADDAWPVVSPDQLAIFFGSDRSSSGDYDIYVATRASPAVQFGTPTRIAELTTAQWEWPTWISPDGCVLYFARSAGPTGGDADMFVATRGL